MVAQPTDFTSNSPPRVFISYRREDCQPQANGLYDGLCNRVPNAEIFMDLDTIPAGADFAHFIETWINKSDIVLVLIGDNWLDETPSGDRRIDREGDFVRLEVVEAISQGKAIVPVLVEGASMPRSADLPDDIAAMARIQAFELSDRRWRGDVERLAQVIAASPAFSARAADETPPPAAMEAVEVADGADESTASEPASGGSQAATGTGEVQLPAKVTAKWLRTRVPSMGAEQLALLTAGLEQRRWTHGDIIDLVYVHADPEVVPRSEIPGDASKASGLEVPARITVPWLWRVAPELNDDQVALLVKELRSRGWSEGEIADNLLSPRDA